MPDIDKDSKTEAATPRRQQQEREQGHVARSADLTAVLVTLFGILALYFFAGNMLKNMKGLMQVPFANLDFAYHSGGGPKDTTALAAELHPIMGFAAPAETHWQSGFGHLFGYDAGYYGYKWSEVFADDMFTRFEAGGPMSPSLGLEYRRGVLERGGAVDGDVLVRDFLGREPSSEAFLKNLGL